MGEFKSWSWVPYKSILSNKRPVKKTKQIQKKCNIEKEHHV